MNQSNRMKKQFSSGIDYEIDFPRRQTATATKTATGN